MRWNKLAEGVRLEAEVTDGARERISAAIYQWFRGGGRGFTQDEWLALEPLEREAAITARERYRGEEIGILALAIRDPRKGEEGHQGLAERFAAMGNDRPPTAEEALAKELGTSTASPLDAEHHEPRSARDEVGKR